jgi:transketolase
VRLCRDLKVALCEETSSVTTTATAKSPATRKRSTSLRPPIARKAGWTELDILAVDTDRALAADAVQ